MSPSSGSCVDAGAETVDGVVTATSAASTAAGSIHCSGVGGDHLPVLINDNPAPACVAAPDNPACCRDDSAACCSPAEVAFSEDAEHERAADLHALCSLGSPPAGFAAAGSCPAPAPVLATFCSAEASLGGGARWLGTKKRGRACVLPPCGAINDFAEGTDTADGGPLFLAAAPVASVANEAPKRSRVDAQSPSRTTACKDAVHGRFDRRGAPTTRDPSLPALGDRYDMGAPTVVSAGAGGCMSGDLGMGGHSVAGIGGVVSSGVGPGKNPSATVLSLMESGGPSGSDLSLLLQPSVLPPPSPSAAPPTTSDCCLSAASSLAQRTRAALAQARPLDRDSKGAEGGVQHIPPAAAADGGGGVLGAARGPVGVNCAVRLASGGVCSGGPIRPNCGNSVSSTYCGGGWVGLGVLRECCRGEQGVATAASTGCVQVRHGWTRRGSDRRCEGVCVLLHLTPFRPGAGARHPKLTLEERVGVPDSLLTSME